VKTSERRAAGFTLIEIMVVVAIIAAVVSILLPRIDNKNNQLKAAVRRFTTLSRELHTRAKLKGATYRLAFDLKEGADAVDQQQYWVERSNQEVTVSEKADEELKQQLKDASKDEKEKKQKDPNGFELDPTIFRGPQEFKKPLKVLLVEKRGYKEPIKTGMAYIYFFPQGMSEMALFQIKADDNLQWTIAIEPLTGRADLLTKLISLKDLQAP
jgi:general secretion pathway protein H